LCLDDLKSFIVRVGPLYGEGDSCSIICDAIKLAGEIGPIPVIGDMDGTVQVDSFRWIYQLF
jgi:hypothetical protein